MISLCNTCKLAFFLLLTMQKEYWDKRWHNRETGWDIGGVSPPLKAYFDQLTDKSLKILIPGCGNAYEAEYLFKSGFTNVYIIEISKAAVASFLKRCPDFPFDKIIIGDFFEYSGQYDRIIEQTFFCAIEPLRRAEYVSKTASLLKPGGMLVGLLFDRFFDDGPPFGGTKEEYIGLFSPYFGIEIIETAYNSIVPRRGTEIFIKMIKNKI